MRKTLLFALSLLALAGLLCYWLAPLATQLPDDYTNEVYYTQKNQFRDSPDGEWQTSKLTARRVDEALIVTGEAILIQGNLQIYFENGDLSFESNGLYGVDRRNRQNLPDYGNVTRSGQYLFPAPTEKASYTLWDPSYIGVQSVTFDHTKRLDGLLVYVFNFAVTGLNETEGYGYLASVPENYLVETKAQGTLWVEPSSGIIVNYQDEGASSFIDPSSGEQIADFNTWVNNFTPETRAAQTQLARAARLRILALGTWLPAASLALGVIVITRTAWQVTRPKAEPARQVSKDGEPL